jgi:hypothetical protein
MHLIQKFAASVNSYGGDRPANIHGTPVVWWDSNNLLHLYVWGEEDFPRHWAYDGTRFQPSGKGKIKAPEMSMPGGMLSLSANGRNLNSGVLWASLPLNGDANLATVAGVLRAFDALDLTKELWNSEQNAGRDHVGMFAKFCPPVVANGKVYLATFAGKSGHANKLVVYGLLSHNQALHSSAAHTIIEEWKIPSSSKPLFSNTAPDWRCCVVLCSGARKTSGSARTIQTAFGISLTIHCSTPTFMFSRQRPTLSHGINMYQIQIILVPCHGQKTSHSRSRSHTPSQTYKSI